MANDATVRRPPAAPPANEDERLAVVRALCPNGGLVDGAPEDPMLQALCKTICKLFQVPIAGVSIVQKDSYSMRACQGLPAEFSIAKRDAFCAWTLLPAVPETLVIEDLTKDWRFMEHPNVRDARQGLRFYAGAPLVTSAQQRVGAVCILDVEPRKMAAEEFNLLNNFSELAVRRLEERHMSELKRTCKTLFRSPSEVGAAVLLCDVSNARWWNVLYANPALAELTGVHPNELVESSFWKLFRPANSEAKNKVLEQLEPSISGGRDFVLQARKREAALDGVVSKQVFEMHFRPASKQSLGSHAGRISVPNFVAAVELGGNKPSTNLFFATVTAGSQGQPDVRLTAVEGAKPHRQRTFYSQEFSNNFPVTSKQPVDEGVADVGMGVLCGQSGDGLVYRGRWRKKPVAVKVMDVKQSECVRSPEFGISYVPKEAAMTLDLVHPSVITTHKVIVENVGATQSVATWIVREWAGLGTLADAIQRGWLLLRDGRPNVRAMLEVALGVASGMAYLHEQGILYGCLGPGSVALAVDDVGSKTNGTATDFSVRLADFSHAVKSDEAVPVAKIADPGHAAPETLAKGHISRASDVYAFGVLWWEICSGQPAWPSLTAAQVQRKLASKESLTMPAELGAGVQALLADCLAHKPTHRPDFADVSRRLSLMSQQEADGQTLTGVAGDDARRARSIRPKFSPGPKLQELKLGGSGRKSPNASGRKAPLDPGLRPPPEMLQQASEDAGQHKKSLFKRLTTKFKA